MSNFKKKQQQLSVLKAFSHLEVWLLPRVANPEEISAAVNLWAVGSLGHRVIMVGWWIWMLRMRLWPAKPHRPLCLCPQFPLESRLSVDQLVIPQGNVRAEGRHFHCANVCFLSICLDFSHCSKAPESVPTEQKRCRAYVGNNQPVLISVYQYVDLEVQDLKEWGIIFTLWEFL